MNDQFLGRHLMASVSESLLRVIFIPLLSIFWTCFNKLLVYCWLRDSALNACRRSSRLRAFPALVRCGGVRAGPRLDRNFLCGWLVYSKVERLAQALGTCRVAVVVRRSNKAASLLTHGLSDGKNMGSLLFAVS